MLRLGKQIGRHIAGIGGLISQYQNLTGACDGINTYVAIYGLLCQSHIDIAGPHDLVYLRHTLRTESQRRDGLGSTHLVDLIHARLTGCHQGIRRYLAVLSGRCGHDNTLHTGHLGRGHVHQNGGRIDCLAAGYIDATGGDGPDFLAKQGAVRLAVEPAVTALLLVVAADIDQGFFDDLQKLRIYLMVSLLDLLFGDADGGCVKLRPVEPLRIGKQGRVFILFYIFDDGVDPFGNSP